MRGFASILFLTILAELLVALAIPIETNQTNRSIDGLLLLRRTEMENGIDEIVREKLQVGLLTQQPPELIKNEINKSIIDYVNGFSNNHTEPITYQTGFRHLTQQSYLSLVLQPVEKPLTLTQLNQNSHVLILPLSQTIRYGEYAYTGGLAGTSIASVHLNANEHQTLFAIPSGYRICGITGNTKLSCIAGEN